MALNRIALESEYDRIYDAANDALKRHNPCQIQRDEAGVVSCADTRRSAQNKYGTPVEKAQSLCCGGCQHLSPQGCTVKSLSCKLWLCTTIRGGFKHEATHPVLVAEIEALRKHGITVGVPMGFRDRKEDVFARLR